ncbi:MAG: hypothetical protein K8953_04705 [Proteobacteria bacterium]|nr:hypothetical protein [Pseudomonadota bacterium]
MTSQEILTRLKELVSTMPDLACFPLPQESHKWLADVYALVDASNLGMEKNDLKKAMDDLSSSIAKPLAVGYAGKVQTVINRAVSILEINNSA